MNFRKIHIVLKEYFHEVQELQLETSLLTGTKRSVCLFTKFQVYITWNMANQEHLV